MEAFLTILQSQNLREVLRYIDLNRRGVVVVVDEEGFLIDTLTDGDARRSFLGGANLETSVAEVLRCKNKGQTNRPFFVLKGTPPEEVMAEMMRRQVRHMPVIDENNRVIDVAWANNLSQESLVPFQAVVMAGGFGRRLKGLTANTPKPMLPVGDQPIVERIINQLRDAGVESIQLSTHFCSEVLQEHFGDGSQFGIDIGYLHEDEPLGTAGALGLMAPPDRSIFVMNGDILTNINFQAMVDYHNEHNAALTLAVRFWHFDVPYGVVETDGWKVSGLREKPQMQFCVNAGIYLVSPQAFRCIPSGQRSDMTDLIQRLLDRNLPVACFPIHEYWLDVGNPEDYARANKEVGSLDNV